MTGTATAGATTEEAAMRPDEVDAQQRAARAADLRRDGYTWAEVADELGYSSGSTACRAVSRLVRRESAESASEYRALMIDRYEALWRAAWTRVRFSEADPAAVTAAVRVADRIVALTGADRPTESELAPTLPTDLDQEIADLLGVIEARARDDARAEFTEPRAITEGD